MDSEPDQQLTETRSDLSVSADQTFWRQRIKEWYPRWSERTYFVPPVYMYTTDYDTVEIAGQKVSISLPPVSKPQKGCTPRLLESDVRDETAMHRVLFSLGELARRQNDVMFVLSQFQFVDFLGDPNFAEAARSFPKPGDLKEEGKDRGDFDVLILHRQYGVLICEVKSVGDVFSSISLTEEEEDDIVGKKVSQAIGQLRKGLDVLNHVTSDMQMSPKVKAALVLPNVTSERLERVVENRPQLKRDLCSCLGVCDTEDPVTFCLTKDGLCDVSAPRDVTDDVIQRLGQWWQTRVSDSGTDTAISDEVYLDLIARFAGPASTVRVVCTSLPRLHMDLRTEGELVSETGLRFTRLMLTPLQLAVLANNLDLVFLTGPPGTGKTVMLYLKALDWLGQGLTVHLVSTNRRSLAATQSLFRQVQQAADAVAKQRLFLQEFDLWKDQQRVVEEAVSTLMQSVEVDGRLSVIMDEAWVGGELTELCDKLHQSVAPGLLRIWTASIFHAKRPSLLTEIVLSEPLRCPPLVIREVEKSERILDGYVKAYAPLSGPPPSEGPTPVYLYHQGQGKTGQGQSGQGQGHEGAEPRVCFQCGVDLAGVLRDLHVGAAAPGRPSSAQNEPPLRFRDVFVLTSMGKVSDADGIVQGLKRNGIPVRVLKSGCGDAIFSDSVAAAVDGDDDAVVVANEDDVRGLERKVVVWLQGERRKADGQQAYDEIWGRVLSLSRCTSQLVCVMLKSD